MPWKSLNDPSTVLPRLYNDARSGNTAQILNFLHNLVDQLFKELDYNANFTLKQPTTFDAPQKSRRFEITYQGIVVAYGAVSATEGLEALKRSESTRFQNEVLGHNNRQVGYVLLTAKTGGLGLKGEFVEVKGGGFQPLVPGQSTVDFEDGTDEQRFRDLLRHCLTFAR